MVVKIAGRDAARHKESVTGVEQTVIAAEKIGLGKVAMVKLEDLGIINVYLNLQVCMKFWIASSNAFRSTCRLFQIAYEGDFWTPK